jgi:hypothetical protein
VAIKRRISEPCEVKLEYPAYLQGENPVGHAKGLGRATVSQVIVDNAEVIDGKIKFVGPKHFSRATGQVIPYYHKGWRMTEFKIVK